MLFTELGYENVKLGVSLRFLMVFGGLWKD